MNKINFTYLIFWSLVQVVYSQSTLEQGQSLLESKLQVEAENKGVTSLLEKAEESS